jgi:hypothetical protein
MPSAPQLLIETDILAEFLVVPFGATSMLREALQVAVCYTTMLNALELFRAARTESEQASILQMLHVVRVLGFHARYAMAFAELSREIESTCSVRITDRDAMILGMARASKLQILTKVMYDRYRKVRVVTVLNSLTDLSAAPQAATSLAT